MFAAVSVASPTPDPSLPLSVERPRWRAALPWVLTAAAAAAAAVWGLASAVLIGTILVFTTGLALAGNSLLFLAVLVAASGVGFGWGESPIGLGSINLSGVRWGVMLLGCGVLLFRSERRLPALLVPYFAFLVVAVAGMAWTPARFEGLKNVLQLTAPALIALVGMQAVRSRADLAPLRHAYWIGLVLGVVAMFGLAFGAPLAGITPPAGSGLYHRGFTMWLLPAYALALAAWRVRGGAWLLMAGVIFLTALVTLARTSIGAMLLMGGVALLVRPARLRPVPLLLLVIATAGALQYGPLRARLFADPRAGFGDQLVSITGEGEDARVSVAGLNMTGRGLFWYRTFDHARERPILGHGSGAAIHYLRDELGLTAAHHPHNDYLRVLHDQGIVGLSLVLAFGASVLVAMRRRWHRGRSPEARELALAALLSMVAYLAVAVFDNSLIYVTFFTANIFLLVAMALRADELDAAA